MKLADAFDVRRTLRRELEPRVCTNIRRRLKSVDMSETQLGKAIGLTQTSTYRRFAGESKWELAELEAVAIILDTTVAKLVGAAK